jgi:hypothetical protein
MMKSMDLTVGDARSLALFHPERFCLIVYSTHWLGFTFRDLHNGDSVQSNLHRHFDDMDV